MAPVRISAGEQAGVGGQAASDQHGRGGAHGAQQLGQAGGDRLVDGQPHHIADAYPTNCDLIGHIIAVLAAAV